MLISRKREIQFIKESQIIRRKFEIEIEFSGLKVDFSR